LPAADATASRPWSAAAKTACLGKMVKINIFIH
jgi:hypothetical protein